jgi:NADH dehydrogenase FAD-containing subunit
MVRRGGWRTADRSQAGWSDDSGTARVVVIGAGFGGLATLKRLTKAGLRVMLVDQHTYSTFQPLLYQVATAGVPPSDIAYPSIPRCVPTHGSNWSAAEWTCG